MFASGLRGRKIVTLTKAHNRFCARRLLRFAIVAAIILLPLVRDRHVLIAKTVAIRENQTIFEQIVNYPRTNFFESNQELHIPNETLRNEKHLLVQPSLLAKTFVENQESTNERLRKREKRVVLHFPETIGDGIEWLMEVEGLNASKAIHLLSDVNASMLHPNLVWIGSPVPHRRLCNMMWFHQALDFYRTRTSGATNTTVKGDWTIHLTDWGDGSSNVTRCKQLESLVGKDKVYYWKRSVVSGRRWNGKAKNVELGQITTQWEDVSVRPLYFPTRSDTVKGIEAAVAGITNRTMSAKELTDYVVMKDRPGDVVHHWPAHGGKVDRGTPNNRNDRLRTRISVALNEMSGSPHNLSDVYCGILGVAGEQGRATTSNPFIESLLRYKIIVVTQRDRFEGHWRMFEGLVSGALVIHDRILSLPPGLEENRNIVFFNTRAELAEKVLYYLKHTQERLAIARRGRQLALWHRMEQIIFGKTITPCDE